MPKRRRLVEGFTKILSIEAGQQPYARIVLKFKSVAQEMTITFSENDIPKFNALIHMLENDVVSYVEDTNSPNEFISRKEFRIPRA